MPNEFDRWLNQTSTFFLLKRLDLCADADYVMIRHLWEAGRKYENEEACARRREHNY